MQLENKTILVVSPQAWGTMYISKHHYAITLARLGNTVYFLNPPEPGLKNTDNFTITGSGIHPNLLLVQHKLWFPVLLKFHALGLFHWLMQFHIKALQKKIGRPVDIVWSFDQGNLYPFRLFDKKAFKIFQPVDEPGNQAALNAANGADIIFPVTREIVDKYNHFPQPCHLVQHGIAEIFFQQPIIPAASKKIRVGISGNLLRNDIDKLVLLQIIRENPGIVFEFWGSYTLEQSNLGGKEDADTKLFISMLQRKNVVLHGPVPQAVYAMALQKMDAFLICYDIQRDQSKGTNYHKVMEYLGTGKVIISNNISAYENQPDLVQMVAERDNNLALPELFKKIMLNSDKYNTALLQQKRKKYALNNTYTKQVERIQQIINGKTADSFVFKPSFAQRTVFDVQ